MNLGRAFAELEAGAELYCLHKNRVVADRRAGAARRRRLRRRPRVRDRRSGDGAREAERRPTSRPRSRCSTPTLRSPGWWATTSTPTSAAPARSGCTRSSSAQASSGDDAGAWSAQPEAVARFDRRRARVRLRVPACDRRDRPDRNRAGAPGARALPVVPRALLHRGRACLLRLAAESAAALRSSLRGQGGDRQGARLRRRSRLRVARGRDRRAGRSPASSSPDACRRGPSESAPARSISR